MNIFFLSMNPRRAAEWHCDRHVVKMILESTQLLWTAWHVLCAGNERILEDLPVKPYRPTHKNHPCARWVRESPANYAWLCALAAALVEEYHYRYPGSRGRGRRAHACEPHIEWLTANPPPFASTSRGPPSLTWPALAMPDEYKKGRNPIASYHAYYRGGKQHILKWTRREPPAWVTTRASQTV